MMKSLSAIILSAALFAACASKYTPPVTFRHFVIEATEATRLDIVCDGKVVYSVKMEQGEPVKIGGPEGPCTFRTDKPVRLLIEPVFDSADDG